MLVILPQSYSSYLDIGLHLLLILSVFLQFEGTRACNLFLFLLIMHTGIHIVQFLTILCTPYIICVYSYQTYFKTRSADLIAYKVKRQQHPIHTDSIETCLALCSRSCVGFAYSEDGNCHLLIHALDGIRHELEANHSYQMYIAKDAQPNTTPGTCSVSKTKTSDITSYMVDSCEFLALFKII